MTPTTSLPTPSATSITLAFLKSCIREDLRGGRLYFGWLATLAAVMLVGAIAYVNQVSEGLVVTGLSNEVSWGAYIANFTFLVGMAAAAVMLVIPSYVFDNQHTRSVVIIAEALAVAACLMAMLFVFVDLGRPERAWHLLPIIGRLHFPSSIMAWDVLVLAGYLVINIAIPFFLLRNRFVGKDPHPAWFGVVIGVAIVWAIAIHTVTAFLYSANVARPFWHTALLGPRFLASAFASGPALILLTFRVIHEFTGYPVPRQVMRFLSIVVTVALLTNLFMVGAEFFTELYSPTEHGTSAAMLFLGDIGPFVHIALGMEIVAAILLVFPRFNHHRRYVLVACALCVVGVWIEKGLALIVPGFTPTPLGEVRAYIPTLTEFLVSAAIWAFGALLFTLLAKPAIAIQLGTLRRSDAAAQGDKS